MTSESAAIRETIRQRYSARAEAAGGLIEVASSAEARCCDGACCSAEPQAAVSTTAACCDESCCVAETAADSGAAALYEAGQLDGLPQASVDAAAGCRNPTAIAEISPGETVLDLGSGGGIDCFLAARQTGEDGRVIGVDMTSRMVELARRNATEMGLANVEFRLGEIEALPVADACVDVIISNCVINLSTDKERTLREAARVLRPGGRLRISDMVWMGPRPQEAGSAEDWAGCVAGAVSLRDYMEGLATAGFRNARAEQVREIEGQGGLASALISAEKADGEDIRRS